MSLHGMQARCDIMSLIHGVGYSAFLYVAKLGQTHLLQS